MSEVKAFVDFKEYCETTGIKWGKDKMLMPPEYLEFLETKYLQLDTLRTENEQLKKAVKDMDKALREDCGVDNIRKILSTHSDIIKKAGGE